MHTPSWRVEGWNLPWPHLHAWPVIAKVPNSLTHPCTLIAFRFVIWFLLCLLLMVPYMFNTSFLLCPLLMSLVVYVQEWLSFGICFGILFWVYRTYEWCLEQNNSQKGLAKNNNKLIKNHWYLPNLLKIELPTCEFVFIVPTIGLVLQKHNTRCAYFSTFEIMEN
jgi:hypothetical protein